MNIREVLNAVFYVLWTGCRWKALPEALPPHSTVWGYLDPCEWDATLTRIHHVPYVGTREQADEKRARPQAVIDGQSAKRALKGGLA